MEKINSSDIALDLVVQDKKGSYINKACNVCLYVSKSAMLEFGRELIRNALHIEGGAVYHFNPAGSGLGIDIKFGVILHPESVEPIIIDDIESTITAHEETELLQLAENIEKTSINTLDQTLRENIALFRVFDLDGRDISQSCQYVILYLHKYSKIALGSELIRLAHNFEEGEEIHVVPASKERGAQQSMGIYLTPDSCELIIKCQSFGPIDSVLEEYKKSHK